MNKVVFSISLIIGLNANAQIIAIDTLPAKMYTELNLQAAGPKWLQLGGSGFKLYNPDRSLYLDVIFPAAPSGFHYQTTPFPWYLTEALFDTDPASLEYIISFQDDQNSLINGVRVMRTDGAILLEDLGHTVGGINGFDAINSTQCVMTSDAGTFMVLNAGGSGLPEESVMYALPGSLPCVLCYGNNVTGTVDHRTANNLQISAFPNPTDHWTTIDFELPPPFSSGMLVFFDEKGAVVLRETVTKSGRINISTSVLPSGLYTYHLETQGQPIGANRLIIVR